VSSVGSIVAAREASRGTFGTHGESPEVVPHDEVFVVDLVGELLDEFVLFEVTELLQFVGLDGDGRGIALGDTFLELGDAVDQRLRTGRAAGDVDVDGMTSSAPLTTLYPSWNGPPETVHEPIETTNLGSGIWS